MSDVKFLDGGTVKHEIFATHTDGRKLYYPVSISSRNVTREYVPEVRPQPDTQTLTQKLTPAEIQEHQRLNDLDTMSTADYKKKWGTDPAVNRR